VGEKEASVDFSVLLSFSSLPPDHWNDAPTTTSYLSFFYSLALHIALTLVKKKRNYIPFLYPFPSFPTFPPLPPGLRSKGRRFPPLSPLLQFFLPPISISFITLATYLLDHDQKKKDEFRPLFPTPPSYSLLLLFLPMMGEDFPLFFSNLP